MLFAGEHFTLPSLWYNLIHTGIRMVLNKIQVNESHTLNVYSDAKFGELAGTVSGHKKGTSRGLFLFKK